MLMQCTRCGKDTRIELRKDSRGLPMFYCLECGNRIKNASTTEVLKYYEEQLADKEGVIRPSDRPICRFCTENLYIRQGRLGTVYRPLDGARYCPMCGREKRPEDTDYKNV